MAFLCPSRLGRNKHKRGYQSMMRKLTEGDKLDTITLEDLVKLSWTTPESRRIILQNFTSCESQEVNVKQGQKVNYIYREGDWAYVVTDDKKEGFVPFIFLAKIGVGPKPTRTTIDTGTYTKRCSDLNPRNFSVESEETEHSGSDLADDAFTSPGWSTDSGSITTVQEYPSVNYLKTEPFEKVPMLYEVFLDERTNILHKNPLPSPGRSDDNEIPDNDNNQRLLQFKVMFNFAGMDLYDVSVKAGEVVDLLDDSDPGWFLVRRSDGYEGYVPSNYISQLSQTSERNPYSDNNTLGSARVTGKIENDKGLPIANEKAGRNEIPITWKVTNELKGKSPITSGNDSIAVTHKHTKQRPKKPPRTKKANLDGLSPRLDESIDSLDTSIAELSVEFLDSLVKSHLDDLSPRSDDFSDSSVFDSSFNGVYGYRQCVSASADKEISPRSLNVHSYDGSTSEDKSDKNWNGKVIGVSKNKKGTQESNCYERTLSCETNDSFESRSSYSQTQRRPSSMPAFRSYQEYKKDYFDEYFYDDADTKFANKSKNDVINVNEILKMRDAIKNKRHTHLKQKNNEQSVKNSDQYHHIRKSSSTAEANNRDGKANSTQKDLQNQPKVKQFLLELPSTIVEIQKDHSNRLLSDKNEKVDINKMNTRKRYHSSSNMQEKYNATIINNEFNGKDDENKSPEKTYSLRQRMVKPKDNRSRQYNSSTDLRLAETTNSGNRDYLFDNKSCNVPTQINENKKKDINLRPYNSSTDLREIGGKPDWSFGYPRRTRKSIGRQENRTSCDSLTKDIGKEQKTSTNRSDERLGQDIAIKGHNITGQTPESRADNCYKVLHNKDACFDDIAMMELLNQTDTLLNKTDFLLHCDKKEQIKKQGTNDVLNQNDTIRDKYMKENNRNDKKDKENNRNDKKDKGLLLSSSVSNTNQSSSLHHSNIEADAADKCQLFLDNSTIGIHGMTCSLTTDKVSADASDGNIDSETQCCSFNSCQSLENDSRKEKSNVMKDNSSKVVFDEIKSMDLYDIRGITEFVCQCDCDNDNDDMLPIKYREIIHICLDGQSDGDKYWAFSPRHKKYGFVLKQNVKIPMVTII